MVFLEVGVQMLLKGSGKGVRGEGKPDKGGKLGIMY